MSDKEGRTAPIALYAPDKALSFDSISTIRPYETYSIEIRSHGYQPVRIEDIQIFADEYSYLPIHLYPLVYPKKYDKPDTYQIPEHLLFHKYGGSNEQRVIKCQECDVMCNDPPDCLFIPQRIMVHMAASKQEGEQYCVPFLYYLKNVACSQLYPTWPYEVLKANIWIQLSFLMQRILSSRCTEHDFPFVLSSNSDKDLLFVENRNLYQSINMAVEEVFHEFIQNVFYSVNTPHAPSHSSIIQLYNPWILLDFSKKGYSIWQILNTIANPMKTYVSCNTKQCKTLETNGVDELIDITELQMQLNIIAKYYQTITTVTPSGIFDTATKKAIMDVQRLLGIAVNGIADKQTRTLISQIKKELCKIKEM